MVLLVWLQLAAATGLDSEIARLRSEVFRETVPGTPGLEAHQIDEDFVRNLFAKEGAVDAVARIFTSRAYWNVNRQVGAIRNRINLEIWAGIVADFGMAVELNNAGKMNGAISDLDQTLFTDAEVIVDRDGRVLAEGRQAVHQFLIAEFARRFGRRMGIAQSPDAPGKHYDMMHFPGDGLLRDWRMSDSRWAEFRAQLDPSVEALSKTEGAYWYPAAYKTQVYTRYLTEGRTIRLEPDMQARGEAPDLLGYDRPEIPDGVRLRFGTTRELSKLYADVPLSIDRSGALGSLLENRHHAVHQRNRLKEVKYTNRETDTALVHATNLEVDFRVLLLEGRTGARRHFIRRIFGAFQDKLPPGIASLDEVQRILEINQRIELDKVIRSLPPPGQRPKSWAAEWQNYEPRNIGDVDTKLAYYDREAEAVRRSLETLEEQPLNMNDPETRRKVAESAESVFRNKSREVTKMGAVRLAQKLFTELFTLQGYVRQRHLLAADPNLQGDPAEAVRRLLAERVADLHVAMVFIDDPVLMDAVMEQAPAETRDVLLRLRAIAEGQRQEIIQRRGAVDAIEAGDLKGGDEVLRHLLRRLDLPFADQELIFKSRTVPQIPGQVRFQSFAGPEWAQRTILQRLHEAILERYRDGQRITSRTVGAAKPGLAGRAADFAAETYVFNLERAQGFFHETLPALFEFQPTWKLGTFGKDYLGSFLDLGTVDSAVKMAAAYSMGNPEAMRQELRDAILGGVPVGGQMFTFARNYQSFQAEGQTFPLASQLATQGLKLFPEGGPYSAMLGHMLIYYSLANTLYEAGWHFYGQPTQNEVVSLVLTGRPGAVPTQGRESRLPLFGEETTAFLKANALLDTHVTVPDLPREWREAVLKQFFLTKANDKAWATTGKMGGAGSGWHAERDRVLQTDYYQNWRYWFQRLWFYHQVHPRLFAQMEAQFRGQNWQRIDRAPPAGMEGAPLAELLAEYGDAYMRQLDGSGYWDHERVHLRRFFLRWLTDWEKKWAAARMEHGEFFTLLDHSRIVGDWRRAVVDELIHYYLEGESFYLAQPGGLTELAGLDGTQQVAAQAHGAALDRLEGNLMDSICREAGAAGRERMELMEALFWHPAIRDGLQQALERAAQSQPAYEPEPPRLELRVARPVGRIGQEIPIGITIRGDTASLPPPDSIQVMVNYQVTSDSVGSRPEGVLRDDVLSLLKADIPGEELRVIAHTATVAVTSSAQPSFRLESSAPLYWIGHKAGETDAEDDSEEREPPGRDGMEDLLAQLRELTARAEGSAAEARRHCDSAGRLAREGGAALDAAATGLAELTGLLGSLEQLRAEVSGAADLASEHQKAVWSSAETLARLRDRTGEEALKTCAAARQIQDSPDAAERARLLETARHHCAEVEKDAAEAKRTYEALQRRAEAVRGIASLHERAWQLFESFPARLEAVVRAIAGAEQTCARAGDAVQLLSGGEQRLQGFSGLGTALAVRGKGELEKRDWPAAERETLGREVDALLGRILAAEAGVKECGAEARAALDGSRQPRNEAAASLETLRKEWDELRGARQESGGPDRIGDILKEVEATEAVAEMFWESVKVHYAQARHCLGIAETSGAAPDLKRVPAVIGLPVAEAKDRLGKAGLTLSLVGGDPAPPDRQPFTVASQSPAPETLIAADAPVTLVVYGEFKPDTAGIPQAPPAMPDAQPLVAPLPADAVNPVEAERLRKLGTWHETEESEFGVFHSTWAWAGERDLRASWQNGSTADLKLTAFDGRHVVVTRNDPAGSSQGLSARYEGTLGEDGMIRGSFTFEFQNGKTKHEGTWTARLEP